MKQLAQAGKDRLERVARLCTLALLVGMPFHAFVVIVLGSVTGYQSFFQAWKEVLSIVLLSSGLVLFASMSRSKQRVYVTPANILVLVIIGLSLVLTLAYGVELVPAVFGIKVVLLPLVLYLGVQLARVHINQDQLMRIILWPSYAVASLALLQEFFIPLSWWTSLGYNSSTILPLQLVDPAVKSIRAFATLGGPNQLGAYLVLPTVLGAVLAVKTKRWPYALGSILTLSGLVVSFSRSAWLGLVVAAIAGVLLLGNKLVRLFTIGLVSAAMVTFIVSASMLPRYLQDTQLQYFLLHGRYSDTQQIEGSDVGRNSAQQQALTTIAREPWGHGLGTAGPASFRAVQPFITESWYLQIGLELGILGLGLFLAFFGVELFALAKMATPFSLALAASVIGLMVTNVFLHAWADSTLGIMIFTLLGIMAYERTRGAKKAEEL